MKSFSHDPSFLVAAALTASAGASPSWSRHHPPIGGRKVVLVEPHEAHTDLVILNAPGGNPLAESGLRDPEPLGRLRVGVEVRGADHDASSVARARACR